MAKGELFAADEWRKHGWNVPACLAGMMLLAFHNYSIGVMIVPLEQEFGWSRAAITTAPALPSLAAIIMAPLVGMAIDRIGVRRIAVAGVPAFCLCLGLLAFAGPSIFSWWALYFLLGVASMFIFPTVWTTAINARFDRNRGKALAITLAGTGISAMVVPTLATALTASFGWRGAYIGLAVIGLVLVFPLVALLLARDEAEPALAAAKPKDERPLRSELLSPRFLKLAGAAFVFGIVGSTLTTNAVPILRAEGLTPMVAANIAGWIGLGSITGRILGGFLLDHFEARKVAAASMVLPAISVMVLLLGAPNLATLSFACFLLGLTAGAEYDACAYLAARHFGMRRFGALFGTIGGLLLAANGIAPPLSNAVFDAMHSYNPVLWALLPLTALTAVLFYAMGDYPQDIESTGPV
jgi:MFS family permease